ncbi:hypothetical protein JY651_39745 [Pyxidicoccus parkwayensis]|uniref:Uncharacterized protein n=1 Tax=Pyxidicoccus parkwayensis TaxID=2813578 RepID=A0ABX7NSD4_9BACT|nr:hypothetical protein [Pyxidicoccus parkwaysis]QSQ21264.1 hypothetical protein JY651_39745 [Pyxidicoccus parkwaysis]
MGAYDYRCLLSGISLRGAECVAIVLQREAEGWQPASLPMRGRYNGYGSIDSDFRERSYIDDQATRSFEDAVGEQRIKLDVEATFSWRRSDREGRDRMLATIERAATGHGTVVFSGRRVVHTLMDAAFFDAICAELTETQESTNALLERVLPTALGRWWYGDLAESPIRDVQSQLRKGLLQVAAVSAWMQQHGIEWATPPVFDGPGEQHDEYQILASYRAACSRFAGEPWSHDVLDRIGPRIEEVMRFYGADEGWIRHLDVSWYAVAIGEARLACTRLEELSARLAEEFYDLSELIGVSAELLVIERGDIAARVDLRRYIRLRGGDRSATLDDVAAWEELLTEPGVEPRLEVAPFDVPALRAPLAVGRGTFSEVLFIVPNPPPAWLTDEEEYAALIPFTFGAADVSGS